MRGISRGTVSLVSLALVWGANAGSVAAADVTAGPRLPMVVLDWTGPYVGLTGGVGRRENVFSNSVANPGVPGGSIGGIRADGAVLGAHAGYNWQVGRAVAGVEADFTLANLSGTSTLVQRTGAVTFSDSFGDHVKTLGTARARLGWLASDKILLYGTAGLAWEYYERSRATGQLPTQFTIVLPSDRFGWVAGAGIEAMLFDPHWIARLEYLHYGFERAEVAQTFVMPTTNSLITAGRQSVDVLRAGLSYKFNEARPADELRSAKAPAATARLGAWTGFYLGAHGGYGWQRSNFSQQIAAAIPALFIGGVDGQGWLAGGHAGYTRRYDRAVAGYEIDFSAADIKGAPISGSYPMNGGLETDTLAYKVQYLGTMRGRLGWLPSETVQLYGTAGLAWERLQRTATQSFLLNSGFPGFNTDIRNIDKFGWVAGLGVEASLGDPNWIGRLEYLHYYFGAIENALSLSSPVPGGTYADKKAGQSVDTLRAGLSYRLGASSGPLQAYAAAPSAVANWSGFYLGAHAGYGWGRNDFSSPLGLAPTSALRNFRNQGFLGGGHAGYNWQIARVVAGFELDASATGIRGDNGPIVYTGTFQGTASYRDKIDYLGTARARLGWLPGDSVLLYGTAGLAWERNVRSATDVQTAPTPVFDDGREASDRFGWVAGIGLEGLLSNSGWVGRVEYLHYDFGTVEGVTKFVTSDPAVTSYAGSAGHQTVDVIRTGLSYKFKPL